jgi:hypothetical protein
VLFYNRLKSAVRVSAIQGTGEEKDDMDAKMRPTVGIVFACCRILKIEVIRSRFAVLPDKLEARFRSYCVGACTV